MSALTGTGTFVRFVARRNRIALPLWAAGAYLLYVSQAVSIDETYATQAEFDKAAASMGSNAAFVAMLGPARVLNTVGGQVAWQATAFGAILAGLMSMFMVGRHTRSEEESGRDELVRSGVVGRRAPVAGTMIVVVGANVVLGLVVAGGLVGYGLPVAGSVSLGVALTLTGLVFAGIALIAAQVTESTRTMYGITGTAIGVSYVLRAVGDIGNGALSWLSPIGWGQAMRAYADETWWPAVLPLGAVVVLVTVAFALFDRRDIGAGLFPPKPGPARAGADLGGALGLAWRLQRGALIGWSSALFLTGLAYGSVGTSVKDLLGDPDSDMAKAVARTGGDLVDSFYSTTGLILALIATGYAISSALRLGAEETAGRVEPMLATRLARARWVASHAVICFGGTALVVALGGLGTGISYALSSGEGDQVLRLLGASLAHVPAVWVLAGLTMALFGLVPRFGTVAWAGLAYCVVAMMFGSVLQMPQWMLDVSPFSHTPLLPVADLVLTPLAVLVLVGAALAVVGFAAFGRRDLQTN